MALETLKDVKKLGEFEVLAERPLDENGEVDWKEFDELRKSKPIYVDHDVNMVSFRIQDGSIKENGVNGCQVDTLIQAASKIISGLNTQFPCRENEYAVEYLNKALKKLEQRRANRVGRGVEGTSQA